MPSVLNVDTLVAANGTDPVTLTKQSAAKAWAKRGGGATPSTLNSLNVSSLTDNGVGDVSYNFGSSFSDGDYSIVALGTDNSGGSNARINPSTSEANTSSLARIFTFNTYSLEAFKDCQTHINVHGDLA